MANLTPVENGSKPTLPTDLPSAAQMAGQHPDRAEFDHPSGVRIRLRHAFWEIVRTRAPRAKGSEAE